MYICVCITHIYIYIYMLYYCNLFARRNEPPELNIIKRKIL